MNTTQHTPGPWYLVAHAEKGWFLLSESGPDIMAEPFDCADADARLISAAPDLLAALENLVEHLDSLPSDNEKCRILKSALNNRSGDLIFAAIAKAKGGAA